ncbi:MAG: MBL fold metallo-hydrolase [Gemmatimonadota bacterium]
MRLQFWGAAREVTGSMHLLTVGKHKVLLDCGLYQGRRKKAFERNRDFPFQPSGVDAVVLSHAHVDHSGSLPVLVKSGFKGRIHATSATRSLCEHMLGDAAHIQENDVKFVNRRRKREGRTLFEPLYTGRDAAAALRRFKPEPYFEPFEPVPGVRVRFLDAGHILGSAVVVLDLTEGERQVRLVFSGDIGREGLPILRDPQVAEGADVVIIESTYGDRSHLPASEARSLLRDCAQKTYDGGGKLLVPAFALGRTQEVVYRLNQLWEGGELPHIDVFVDSPLAVRVTDVFRAHPECYDEDMRKAALSESDGDPLGFERLRYVRSVEESKQLNSSPDPAVVISASGMCEAGRILHHLRNHATSPNTTILFVGYQAEHTLGRRLLEGNREVKIFGQPVEVKARVERADNYSAHADREGLLDWARGTMESGDVKRFFVVHGEERVAESFAGRLTELGARRVYVPKRGQTFEF